MLRGRLSFVVWVIVRGEAYLVHSEKVTDSTPIPPPDWEVLISVIADEILAERSPAQILLVRSRLYDLLTHCIPPTTILKVWSILHADRPSILKRIKEGANNHSDPHFQADRQGR